MALQQVVHSKKYHQILTTAEELFFKYSTKRVSVEEICEKANVSKMTFYRYFTNKHELAERIIRIIFEEASAKLDNTAQRDIPFMEKLDIMLKYKLEFMERMSSEYIEEYIDRVQGTMMHAWIQKVMGFLTQAQQRGEIRADIRPELIMYMADKLSETVKDKRILHVYSDDYSELTRDAWKMLYYGLLPRNDEALDGEQ